MEHKMSMGDNLIPLEDGWAEDIERGYRISPEGTVYDRHGEVVDPPYDEEAYRDESPDEDWQ